MKALKLLLVVSILFSLMPSLSLHAQTEGISKDEWLQQMENEEQKITAYVNEQLQNTAVADSLKQTFLLSEHEEVKENDLPKLADKYVQDFYRTKYMTSHPEVLKIYNPGRIQLDHENLNNKARPDALMKNILCSEGNFESGIGTSFKGYESPVNYNGGLCGFIPTTNVAYTNVGFSNPDNFLLTNNLPDPIIPALNQSNNSNHAIRINAATPCWRDQGLNMLQKPFSSSVSGRVRINFSYALVMEDPDDGNPFFVARVLNNAGIEVGRICRTPSIPDPFFQHVTVDIPGCERAASVVWRDWGCDFIEFNMEQNKTYTIEFFVADCGGGGHFGYAYVDDICADVSCCPPAPHDLRCEMTDDGNILSWNPVTNAVGYQLVIYANDPACCKNSNYPFMAVWNVSGTDTTVPRSFAPCFSWYVNSVCEDGSLSETLQKKCSCLPECPAPANWNCVPVTGGNKISWNPVSGALGYQLIIYNNDPLCCNNGTLSFMSVWNVSGTDTIVPASFSPCFSWYINTVCQDGMISETLQKRCSCPPDCTTPTNLKCQQVNNGSKLSWDPVPGAVNYQLIMEHNDPFCCQDNTYPFMAVWTVHGTDTVVPNSFTHCFSWYVNTVCPDGTITKTLIKKCSCSPVPPSAPDSLGCVPTGTGIIYYWNQVPGAVYYKVSVTINDPLCCPGNNPVNTVEANITGSTSFFIPNTATDCFSWKVSAVMPDSSSTPWSITLCTCRKPQGRPANDPEQSLNSINPAEGKIFVTAIPNPASEYIEFEMNKDTKTNIHEFMLYLYDINGREVVKKEITDHNKLKIDVQSYPEGIYIYEIRSKNISLFQDKVVIKKQ